MNTFLLIVSSPGGDLFRKQVVAIYLRGTEGELAVMAGHIPFVTTIKPCDCKIALEDGSEITAHTDGGILTVSNEKTTYLTGSFSTL